MGQALHCQCCKQSSPATQLNEFQTLHIGQATLGESSNGGSSCSNACFYRSAAAEDIASSIQEEDHATGNWSRCKCWCAHDAGSETHCGMYLTRHKFAMDKDAATPETSCGGSTESKERELGDGDAWKQAFISGQCLSLDDEDTLIDALHENYREITSDDGTYRGQVVDSHGYHGHGCLRSLSFTALGEWRDGRMHGSGHQSWADGRQYTGQFEDGAFSGAGRMVWHHPRGMMVYEGQYMNDKKHGWGKFTWPNGKCYEGHWFGGSRHGAGTEIFRGEKIRGVWEDNNLVSLDEDAVDVVELDDKDAAVA